MAKLAAKTKTVRLGRVVMDRPGVVQPDGSVLGTATPGWGWIVGMARARLGARPTRRRKDEALAMLRDSGVPDELAVPIVEGTATWVPDGDSVLVTLPA